MASDSDTMDDPSMGEADLVHTPLSKDIIRMATGTENLEELEEMELLLLPITDVSEIEYCKNLRKLSIINCCLSSTAGLSCLSGTLKELCLSGQQIAVMQDLNLPQLTVLRLHENRIMRIEGLSGCPNLRTLWLSCNKIDSMEGLHYCEDLRELWLQENEIGTIPLDFELPVLQHLCLAGNKIGNIEDLKALSNCPMLEEISLAHPDFGFCPVVGQSGYKLMMLNMLPNLRMLDGREVREEDAVTSRHIYLKKILQLTDELHIARTRADAEHRRIDEESRRAELEIEQMEKRSAEAFESFCAAILESSASFSAGLEKTEATLRQAMNDVVEYAKKLQTDVEEAIQKKLDDEKKSWEQEDWRLSILESRMLSVIALADRLRELPSPLLSNRLSNSVPGWVDWLTEEVSGVSQSFKVMETYELHVPIAGSTDNSLKKSDEKCLYYYLSGWDEIKSLIVALMALEAHSPDEETNCSSKREQQEKDSIKVTPDDKSLPEQPVSGEKLAQSSTVGGSAEKYEADFEGETNIDEEQIRDQKIDEIEGNCDAKAEKEFALFTCPSLALSFACVSGPDSECEDAKAKGASNLSTGTHIEKLCYDFALKACAPLPVCSCVLQVCVTAEVRERGSPFSTDKSEVLSASISQLRPGIIGRLRYMILTPSLGSEHETTLEEMAAEATSALPLAQEWGKAVKPRTHTDGCDQVTRPATLPWASEWESVWLNDPEMRKIAEMSREGKAELHRRLLHQMNT